MPAVFYESLKKATSNTPTEYIQRVKGEAAKKHLETTVLHIQEVMINVGHMDEKAFRNIFKSTQVFHQSITAPSIIEKWLLRKRMLL